MDKEKEEYVMGEIRGCFECSKLKMDDMIPPVCQEHLDMQFEE